jgi:PKD repeat protein
MQLWNGGLSTRASLIAIDSASSDVVFHNNSRVFSTTIVNWDFGDGGVSNVFSPTHNYSLPGSYTVRLIVIDSTSCNIADTAYQNVLIIKNGRDTLSQLVVCDSQSVQLGFAPISDTSVTYLWTPSASLSRPDISNPIATPT